MRQRGEEEEEEDAGDELGIEGIEGIEGMSTEEGGGMDVETEDTEEGENGGTLKERLPWMGDSLLIGEEKNEEEEEGEDETVEKEDGGVEVEMSVRTTGVAE